MEKVKIKKVDVTNLKAISSFTAIFDGKSAHVTGANGIGKSTLIRAFTDRLRGLKPSIITRIGEKEGKTVMELTDGCRFEWLYNNQGKDQLNYYTPDSVLPVKRDIFKHICGQYFPNQFDINKFLTTTEPRKRLQMISELVNVDLTEIQARYKIAFDTRKDAKKELKILEAQIKPEPEEKVFDGSNIDEYQNNVDKLLNSIGEKEQEIEEKRAELNQKYIANKKLNDIKESEHQEAYKKQLDEWLESEELRESEINNFNLIQDSKNNKIDNAHGILNQITDLLQDSIFEPDFDLLTARNRITALPSPESKKEFVSTPKPELTSLELPDPMPDSSELDELIVALNSLKENRSKAVEVLETKKSELSESESSKKVYELQLNQWSDFQKQVKKQFDYVQECEQDVEDVLQEIKDMVSKTKLPDEFSIDLTNKNDILFRTEPGAEYLPITVETLASSAIFIAAFKLQANYLDAFRVAHFDVSYLDYENRQKVLKEAINMDIQLITESPALEEGKKELQYIITE